MGYYCTVPQCTSLAGKTKNVKFHRFPRDESMADKWNIILKRGKPYTKYSKVCSLHFTQADYNVTTMGQWKTLSKDAVPSQNLPKLHPDGTVMVIRKSRTVKYREGKKDDVEKQDRWALAMPQNHNLVPSSPVSHMNCDPQDPLNYRYPINPMNISPQQIHGNHSNHSSHGALAIKPKKQDAIMQTEPVNSEEDDSQPNNSYSDVYAKSSVDSEMDYPQSYPKEQEYDNKYEAKDYTNKPEEYIPRTNEEYNKEAERYALERKSLNGYDTKPLPDNFKPVDNDYQKISDIYPFNDKPYQRNDYINYSYHDTVEHLRNQQQNLQMLQEHHRVTENQNFFNENHIKQEVENNEDDKFLYDRNKEQIDADLYNRKILDQQRLLETLQHPVKQEPETGNGCDSVMQPQGSPYYQANSHSNVSAQYYSSPRPGPELLIAKQNALAAHTQLWQNTMKRPFFYSENSHYTGPPLLHRYEDIPRILQ